jgi:uncharacterized protein YwgA
MTADTDTNFEVDDAIVLLLGAPTQNRSSGEIRGVTRLEKLVFLLERETSANEWLTEDAEFKAYNYGPFSSKVYQAVDLLSAADLVTDSGQQSADEEDAWEKENAIFDRNDLDPYATRDFKLTADGWQYYEALASEIGPEKIKEISDFKSQFANIPLRQLVRYVYERYDEFTSRSVIRDDILGR